MSVNRPELGRIWALKGARFDPGAQKYSLGWTAEIPTYEVLNYLQYRVDLALLAASERGIPEWGSDLTYGLGSVVWDNTTSKIYVSKVAAPNKSKAPNTNSAEWEESCTQLTMNAFLQIDQKFDAHIGRTDNPHGVTAEQVNTYSKSVIDQKVGNVATDLSNHANRKDNPHGVNAAQIGAVPISGGTYTGAVTFNSQETKINPGAGDHAVRADSDGVSLRFDNVYLGVRKSDKRAFLNVDGNTSLLLNESQYADARKAIEPEYAVPTPDVWIDALNDIHLKQGVGFTELVRNTNTSYIDKSGRAQASAIGEPRHTAGGLLISGAHPEYLALDAPNNIAGAVEGTYFIEGIWHYVEGDTWLMHDNSGRRDRIFVDRTGRVKVQYENVDGAYFTLDAGAVQSGKVFRLVVAFDAAHTYTYLNGVAGQEQAIAFGPSAVYSKVYFGRTDAVSNNYWEMRQFKSWYRKLTPKQISTL